MARFKKLTLPELPVKMSTTLLTFPLPFLPIINFQFQRQPTLYRRWFPVTEKFWCIAWRESAGKYCSFFVWIFYICPFETHFLSEIIDNVQVGFNRHRVPHPEEEIHDSKVDRNDSGETIHRSERRFRWTTCRAQRHCSRPQSVVVECGKTNLRKNPCPKLPLLGTPSYKMLEKFTPSVGKILVSWNVFYYRLSDFLFRQWPICYTLASH